jgi:membrane protein YqaA with SNARE-associated domain
MTVKFSYVAIFAGGLILGALAQYGLGQVFSTQAEKTWRTEHGEDANHARIMAFQDVLKKQRPAKDADELTKQIEVQLKIEELVIQSRAAQYANLTPFTSFGSSVGALLVALLGFIAGLIGKKRGAAAIPNP